MQASLRPCNTHAPAQTNNTHPPTTTPCAPDARTWIALPFAGMYASTVVVYRPPANFSFSDLRPLMTGTASSSSYTRAYRSRMVRT